MLLKILFDEQGATLAITRKTSNTLITSSGFNVNYDEIEAVVNALDGDNIEDDAIDKEHIAVGVVRADYGLAQHTTGALQVDPSDTNPALEITDGGVRVKVDGTTIERTSSGLAVVTGAVTDHGNLTGLSDDDHSIYHNDARAVTWHDADDHSGLSYAPSGANSNITSLSGLTSLSSIAKVVAYTGNGVDNRTVAHGLGRAPIRVVITHTLGGLTPMFFMTGMTNGQNFSGTSAPTSIKSVNATNVILGTDAAVNGNGTAYVMFVL